MAPLLVDRSANRTIQQKGRESPQSTVSISLSVSDVETAALDGIRPNNLTAPRRCGGIPTECRSTRVKGELGINSLDADVEVDGAHPQGARVDTGAAESPRPINTSTQEEKLRANLDEAKEENEQETGQ